MFPKKKMIDLESCSFVIEIFAHKKTTPGFCLVMSGFLIFESDGMRIVSLL